MAQRLLKPAFEGDPTAFQAILDLSKENPPVLRVLLPIVTFYLKTQPPHHDIDPTEEDPKNSKSSSLVAIALEALYYYMSLERPADIACSSSLQATLLENASRILVWTHHFFQTWVFNVPSTRKLSPVNRAFRARVLQVALMLTSGMTVYNDVCRRLLDDVKLGSLFGMFNIVAFREDQSHLQVTGKVIRYQLQLEYGRERAWEREFVRSCKRECAWEWVRERERVGERT